MIHNSETFSHFIKITINHSVLHGVLKRLWIYWFGLVWKGARLGKQFTFKKCKIGLEITKKDDLNYGKERCKIGLLKNGAKLRTKFTFQKMLKYINQ